MTSKRYGTPPKRSSVYMTVAEVAEVMRVSKMTIHRLVNSGVLDAKKIGRSIRIHERAVDDFMAAADVVQS